MRGRKTSETDTDDTESYETLFKYDQTGNLIGYDDGTTTENKIDSACTIRADYVMLQFSMTGRVLR
ncbi:MAG: hypothetical protein JRF40_09705 [Deltaproteobacteria bacterium]|nr:hypothetical protein [Deltaproteobacteria bacterium]MBW2219747.1 hypothetical protein [Deltaproteobacteria bacterium]